MSRFETGELYHIYNRGVEKRNIFLKEPDYRRFLFILYLFNDKNSSTNTLRKVNTPNRRSKESVRNRISHTLVLKSEPSEPKEQLVEIKEFCLMPNHFHLLIKQRLDDGISKFMQKVGVGYTHYFNKKYDRNGVLFQGKTKSKHIDSDPYLMWIKRYIHLNPVDVVAPLVKNRGARNLKNIIEKLNKYKWVSCNDYNFYREDLKEDLGEILKRDWK